MIERFVPCILYSFDLSQFIETKKSYFINKISFYTDQKIIKTNVLGRIFKIPWQKVKGVEIVEKKYHLINTTINEIAAYHIFGK